MPVPTTIVGFAYYRKGDYDRAIADYDKAIQLNLQYTGAYNNRGSAHADKGDYDRALADYSEAIKLDPQHVGAYYNLGNMTGKKATMSARLPTIQRSSDSNLISHRHIKIEQKHTKRLAIRPKLRQTGIRLPT